VSTVPVPARPKAFVSYSWTTQKHVDRILEWCSRLCQEGVDIEIDKWSLAQGHDKYAYMERMVKDPSITHVLIFSDAKYAQKADDRSRGVGTETQIISAEIYGEVKQDKFLPIVCEYHEGEPCLPVFLKHLIYFDFSSPEKVAEEWDKLLRRLHNKPLYTKPKIGAMPAHLEVGALPARITVGKLAQLKEALHQNRPTAKALIADYTSSLVAHLEEYRIPVPATPEEYAVRLHASLDALLPLRNEIIEFFELVLTTQPTTEAVDQVADLLQDLLPYRFRPESVSSFNKWWWDNYAFFLHELYLYTVALFIKLRQFEALGTFFERRYVLPASVLGNARALPFSVFRSHSEILSHESKKAGQNRLSVEADLFKQRASLKALPFTALMQADLMICLRMMIHPAAVDLWPPLTLGYAEYSDTFELFIRAQERRWFKRIASALGISDKAELVAKRGEWSKNHADQLGWLVTHADLNVDQLIGLEKLDTVGS